MNTYYTCFCDTTTAHYQYPRNRTQGGLSPSSTPSTVAATTDEPISNRNSRYGEVPDVIESPEPDYGQISNKSVRKETDYMTLKADDVQRKRMESNVPGDITDSGLKKSISGFAQPGPQSPNNDDSENCNKSNRLNEDDSSKSFLFELLFYLTRLI